jgi:hypothetical protein
MWEYKALEEFPSGVGMLVALEELAFNGCESLTKICGRITGFDMFKDTWYEGMRGLGRISIWSRHACDIGGIGGSAIL